MIAIAARTIAKKLNPCCYCGTGEIVHEHSIHYCLGHYKAEYEYKYNSESLPSKTINKLEREVEIIGGGIEQHLRGFWNDIRPQN